MNKWEIEVQKSLLNSEKAALAELEKQYRQALKDINAKVKQFQADIDLLDEAMNQDGLDDAARAMLQSQKQSKIYQQQYQTALKSQVSSVLDKMQGDNYSTIDKYLKQCYDTGYIGTMYDISKQGIPVIAPIDQAATVKAILTDSKISKGLYTRLGVEVSKLKKTITQEISRGIASGLSYSDIARNLSNVSSAPLSRTNTIARTEGHRIQQQSTADAQAAAKAKGADVVKQWDAALDSRTRDSHRRVDGEIREIGEKFSNGLRYPGDPRGKAAEVINCRCTCDTRARWALDEEELKTLQERAEYFGLDKTANFEEYMEKYLGAADNIFSVENPIKGMDFSNLTEEEAAQAIQAAMFNLQAQTEEMDYPYGLVFGHQASTARVQVDKGSNRAYSYNSKDDVVYVNPYDTNFSAYDFNEAMLHELAHRYDRTAVTSWSSQEFKSSLTKAKEYAIRNAEALRNMVHDYPEDYYLQDIISIVSGGSIEVLAGHAQLSKDAEAREVFANLASLRARNTESYNALKNELPSLINEFELLFGGE